MKLKIIHRFHRSFGVHPVSSSRKWPTIKTSSRNFHWIIDAIFNDFLCWFCEERRLQLIPSYSQSFGEGSAQSKTRMMAPNQQLGKVNVNNPVSVTVGAGDARSNQKQPAFPRNNASTTGIQKNDAPTGTFFLWFLSHLNLTRLLLNILLKLFPWWLLHSLLKLGRRWCFSMRCGRGAEWNPNKQLINSCDAGELAK